MVDHQVIATAVVGYVWAAVIGALPAPTANSGTFYQFMFKFLNILGANIARSQAKVENSPNFQAAVNIQTDLAGQPAIKVIPSPPAPAAEPKP
jgi:hypothetical protein